MGNVASQHYDGTRDSPRVDDTFVFARNISETRGILSNAGRNAGLSSSAPCPRPSRPRRESWSFTGDTAGVVARLGTRLEARLETGTSRGMSSRTSRDSHRNRSGAAVGSPFSSADTKASPDIQAGGRPRESRPETVSVAESQKGDQPDWNVERFRICLTWQNHWSSNQKARLNLSRLHSRNAPNRTPLDLRPSPRTARLFSHILSTL